MSTRSKPTVTDEDKDAAAAAKSEAEGADSATAEQVQEVVDKETEQGFRGVEVDPTPNENYSVAGVTSGAPTPETDDDQAEAVRQHAKDVQSQAAGVAEK